MVAIPMKGVLHLKSVCTALDDHTVLVNPRHFDTAEFSEYRLIEVPADESMAANVLRINGTVCMHAGFHQTADLLRTQGFDIKTVDISEFLKAEAGLTCMSIILHASNSQLTVVANAPSGHGVGPLVLLPNGSVFVGGGSVFGNDIVNLATDQWTNIAPPPCTSSKQSCESAGVLLNTGKVLVAGGGTMVNARPYPIEETNGLAALLDLSSLTWASTGSMSKSRIAETATVLLSGQVLFAGGETFDKHLGHLVPIMNKPECRVCARTTDHPNPIRGRFCPAR